MVDEVSVRCNCKAKMYIKKEKGVVAKAPDYSATRNATTACWVVTNK